MKHESLLALLLYERFLQGLIMKILKFFNGFLAARFREYRSILIKTLLRKIFVALSLLIIPESASAQNVNYLHVDYLGSVTAETDSTALVLSRREYEPYGLQISAPLESGPGFVGHVQDVPSGLIYMQQRYYDPQIGIFMSVDGVSPRTAPMQHFNRYRYASNNPYSRIDPDGNRDIYVGGALDKEYTRNVQFYAERAASHETRVGRDIQFFGAHEVDKIAAAIDMPTASGEPINVIGHSLGARAAIQAISQASAEITNLITIDPVGSTFTGKRPSSVNNWINVTARSRDFDSSDVIAYVGRRLEGVTNTRSADVNKVTTRQHGEFSGMMRDIDASNVIDKSYELKRRSP